MSQSFKTTVKEKLIQSAKSYSKLLAKRIVIFSDDFIHSNSFTIRFFKTNFLHLTGVTTSLSTELFFERCFNGEISENDFALDNTSEQKGLVRLKMKHLPTIDTFFNQTLLVQEDFEKGSIRCLIATSDGKCTIGFVDAKYHVRPKTILDKNHLKKDRAIICVSPQILDV